MKFKPIQIYEEAALFQSCVNEVDSLLDSDSDCDDFKKIDYESTISLPTDNENDSVCLNYSSKTHE